MKQIILSSSNLLIKNFLALNSSFFGFECHYNYMNKIILSSSNLNSSKGFLAPTLNLET